ncbi:MAG: sulfotransferase [Pseudomonadota bacterium]
MGRIQPKTFLFCIGAQKSGTSSLYQFLRKHPKIELGPIKELHYFNSVETGFAAKRSRRMKVKAWDALLKGEEVRDGSNRLKTALAYRRLSKSFERPLDLEIYRDLTFRSNKAAIIVGEITPNYATFGSKQFALMDQVHPDCRYVFTMRDPIARAWSGLRMSLRRAGVPSSIPLVDLEAAVLKMIKDQGRQFLKRCNYRRTIESLDAVVPRSRSHFMFFEEFTGDQKNSTAKELLNFLEVGYDQDPTNVAHYPGKLYPIPTAIEHKLFEITRPQYESLPDLIGRATPAAWLHSYERLKSEFG